MMNNINFARIFIYSALLFFCLVYLMPLFVMALTSFKTLPDIKAGNLMLGIKRGTPLVLA